ncbi:MAG: hypothetical protein ABIK47_04855 [candidate division WOR-3 bacterium]
MKLRFIIWAVVGVVVVAGVIFLVLSGKTPQKKVTINDLRLQIERDEKTINELTAKLAQARAVPLPPANAELLSQAETNLNDARTLIEKAKQSENIRDVEANLREAHSLLTKCRRLLRAATKPTG